MSEAAEVVSMIHPILKKTLEKGIPVWKAEFQSAVNNSDDVPEHFFSAQSNLKSRNVKMLWVPSDGLYCFHKEKYFYVPSANMRYLKFE